MSDEFKTGDKVVYDNSMEAEVVAVLGRFAWVTKPGTEQPWTVYLRDLKKPKPPFFEVGKKYKYFTNWSTVFQVGQVDIFFEPLTVVEESGGGPVAFGKLTNSKNADYQYVTYTLYSYKALEWKVKL